MCQWGLGATFFSKREAEMQHSIYAISEEFRTSVEASWNVIQSLDCLDILLKSSMESFWGPRFLE